MADQTDVDPGIERWLERVATLAAALPPATSMEQRRANAHTLSDDLAREFGIALDTRTESTDVEFPNGLRARRHRPRGADGPLPTQVFLHGGGFVTGSAWELLNDGILSERAARSGVQIYALEYRLAPEHPYPAPIDDTLAVLHDLASEERWGADPARLGVGGGSAGGHIAAVTALRARTAPGPTLVHQLLEVPALSFREDWPSMIEYASAEERDGARQVAQAYRGGSTAADEFFDPVEVADLAGAAPAFVMTAERDPLRDGGEAYAQRLEKAGVPVVLRRAAGQLHGTPGLVTTVPSSRAWQEAAITALQTGYAPG